MLESKINDLQREMKIDAVASIPKTRAQQTTLMSYSGS